MPDKAIVRKLTDFLFGRYRVDSHKERPERIWLLEIEGDQGKRVRKIARVLGDDMVLVQLEIDQKTIMGKMRVRKGKTVVINVTDPVVLPNYVEIVSVQIPTKIPLQGDPLH